MEQTATANKAHLESTTGPDETMGHEHKEPHFVLKYIFSQDHKMISKQFLIIRKKTEIERIENNQMYRWLKLTSED